MTVGQGQGDASVPPRQPSCGNFACAWRAYREAQVELRTTEGNCGPPRGSSRFGGSTRISRGTPSTRRRRFSVKPAVVSASCHPPKAGAVLGFTNGYLLPMAAWVVVGRLGGFVRGTFRFLLAPLVPPAGTGREPPKSRFSTSRALPGAGAGSPRYGRTVWNVGSPRDLWGRMAESPAS